MEQETPNVRLNPKLLNEPSLHCPMAIGWFWLQQLSSKEFGEYCIWIYQLDKNFLKTSLLP